MALKKKSGKSFKERLLESGQRPSKNVKDIRDPLAAAKHNLKYRFKESAEANTKLRDKTPISKQEDVYTDLVNYGLHNIPKIAEDRAKKAIRKDTIKDKPTRFSKDYNAQVTPGKWETKEK